MTRKHIQFALSLLITAACLYLAFRSVRFDLLWDGFKTVNYLWLLPFVVVTTLSMYLRAVRWKYLLEPVVNVPSYTLFPPLIICFALNGILPGRAGEFARAYLVAKDYRVKFSSTIGTVIVERIADGVGLLILFVVILYFVPLTGSVQLEWGKKTFAINAAQLGALTNKLLIASLVLLAGAILMLWGPFRDLVLGIVRRVPLLPHKFKDGLIHFIETFVHGFHSLRSPRLVFWVIFHTGTVWLTVGLSLWIISYGFPNIQMTFLKGMATSIIICIAILIPAAPGYWGLYEVGCILALQMLGAVQPGPAGNAAALNYSLVIHFFQMVCTIAPGMFFLWRRQVKISELTHAEATNQENEKEEEVRSSKL